MEALAESLYHADVVPLRPMDFRKSVAWADCPESSREEYRHLARVAYAALASQADAGDREVVMKYGGAVADYHTGGGSGDEVSNRLHALLSRLATLRAALAQRSKPDLCGVCAGTGKPVSGLPCICGGSGTAIAEMLGLREELYDTRAALATAEAERDAEAAALSAAGRVFLQIIVEAVPGFADAAIVGEVSPAKHALAAVATLKRECLSLRAERDALAQRVGEVEKVVAAAQRWYDGDDTVLAEAVQAYRAALAGRKGEGT